MVGHTKADGTYSQTFGTNKYGVAFGPIGFAHRRHLTIWWLRSPIATRVQCFQVKEDGSAEMYVAKQTYSFGVAFGFNGHAP